MSRLDYTQSPACKMLATHCAVCRRALVDAVSVELGIGPDCRGKYLKYPEGISEIERREANAIVHYVAIHNSGDDVVEAVFTLQNMGFGALAQRIGKRLAKLRVEAIEGGVSFFFPYAPGVVKSFRAALPGARFQYAPKPHWQVGEANKAALWAFIKGAFHGQLLVSPKGLVTVGAE